MRLKGLWKEVRDRDRRDFGAESFEDLAPAYAGNSEVQRITIRTEAGIYFRFHRAGIFAAIIVFSRPYPRRQERTEPRGDRGQTFKLSATVSFYIRRRHRMDGFSVRRMRLALTEIFLKNVPYKIQVMPSRVRSSGRSARFAPRRVISDRPVKVPFQPESTTSSADHETINGRSPF